MAYYNSRPVIPDAGRNVFPPQLQDHGRRNDYSTDDRRNGYKTTPDYGGTPFMEVPLPEWKVPSPGLFSYVWTIPGYIWNSWGSRSGRSSTTAPRLEGGYAGGGVQRPPTPNKTRDFEPNYRSFESSGAHLGKGDTTSRGSDDHHARNEAYSNDLEVRFKQKDTTIGRLESDIKLLEKRFKDLESDFFAKLRSYYLEKMRAEDLEKVNRECQDRLRMEKTRAESLETEYLVKLRTEKARGQDALEKEKREYQGKLQAALQSEKREYQGKVQAALQSEKMRGDNLERENRECQAKLQVKEREVGELQVRLQGQGAATAALEVREAELKILQRENQELKRENQELKRESQELKRESQELKRESQELKRESQELKSWKLEQERMVESDMSTTGELNTKVSQLTTAHDQLEKQKQTLATNVQDQDKRIQELKQQVSVLKMKIEATDSEAQSLRERLRGERDKTSKLSEALQQKDSRIEELMQELMQLGLEQKSSSDRIAPADAQLAALQAQVRSKESETLSLKARLREEVENTARLNGRLEQCNVEIDDLKHQIRDLARGRDTDSVDFLIPPPPPPPRDYIGGESFLETEATPYLLSGAVQRVHEVAGIFARLLMKAMEQGKIDGMAVARNNYVRSISLGKAAPLKYVLEAITCKILFQGFEHECFDLQDSTSGFLDMEQQRVDNFREYKYLSAIENPEQMVHKADNLFTHFCRIKLESLSTAIPEIEGMVQEIISRTFEHSFSSDESGDADVESFLAAKLGVTFVKLAVCVWQVHKLVFSFNPMARIFRVAQSEKFVHEYMESVIFQESESDDDDDMVSVDISRVDFLVVPGFLINKIVIRSKVFVVTKPVSKAFWIPNGSS